MSSHPIDVTRPSRPALVLVAVSLLAACGGDAAGPASAPPAAPATTPSSPPATPAPAPAPAAAPTGPAAELGAPAPAFSLADLDGTTHTLAQYAGKTVVLEWFNPECPFVNHAHGPGGALETAAKNATAQGIVWLAINSGAPGKQGAGPEKNRDGASRFGLAHPILLDDSGATGKAYGALKTPHVFVIDPKGVLVYRGGVDNAPMGEVDGGGARVDYLQAALADLAAGRPVATAEARPYGCSVKYGA